jgi:membrane-associated phospholipid phosphatase
VNRLQRGLLLGSAFAVLAVVVPLAVLVGRQWDPLVRTDIKVHDALIVQHGLGRDVVLALTQLGAPLLLELIAVVAAVVYIRRGRRRVAAFVLTSVFGAETLSVLLKLLVGRQRPCLDHLGCPMTSSFPSGHAVGSAAFWVTAAVLLLPVLGGRSWWLVALAPLVALTRLLLGVHYLTDVTAGLFVGGCWAAAITAVFAAWRDERAGREVPLEQGVG